MPKYLVQGSYTQAGLQGVRQVGAASREQAGRTLAESLGGTLECYYFAFGEYDVIVVVDLPDDEAAAAMSIAANTGGALKAVVTKLLTPAQVDQALSLSPDYRPPGS